MSDIRNIKFTRMGGGENTPHHPVRCQGMPPAVVVSEKLPNDARSVIELAKSTAEEAVRLMGHSIEDIEQTTISNTSHGENVLTITLKDGHIRKFVVRNGTDADIAGASAARDAANKAANDAMKAKSESVAQTNIAVAATNSANSAAESARNASTEAIGAANNANDAASSARTAASAANTAKNNAETATTDANEAKTLANAAAEKANASAGVVESLLGDLYGESGVLSTGSIYMDITTLELSSSNNGPTIETNSPFVLNPGDSLTIKSNGGGMLDLYEVESYENGKRATHLKYQSVNYDENCSYIEYKNNKGYSIVVFTTSEEDAPSGTYKIIKSKNIVERAQEIIDTFESNESQRQATFEESEASRATTFTQSEASRTTTFEQSEASRNTTFQASEASRNTTFQASEASRNTTFEAKEAERDAANEAATNAAAQLSELAQQVNTAIEEVKKLNDLFGNGVEGYVRVSGTSDPAFNYLEYKHTVGTESVFDCLKPCLVGNNFTGHVGEILHVLNPLNWYVDEHGDARKIDGSEGEVLICNVRSVWEIAQHVTVGAVTYDVFLRSYTPFEWMGTPASEIKPMGIAPHFCVAHKDEDNVTRMHSAYNMEWDGSYQAQHSVVGKYVQTQEEDGSISEEYDADGAIFGGAGGLHTTDLSLMTGEQYAMNINEDTTKTYPYFNATARAEELMYAAMVAEGGTFDAHHPLLMGSGFCCNDATTSDAHWAETEASARNGFRYQKADGTWVNLNISKRGNEGFNAAMTGDNQCTCCYLNFWRSPWRVMEQQRVMIYAIEHNVPELTWFAFEGNKYKWRHVEGFAGPSEGAMTCVVWKCFASKFGEGCVDTTTSLDVSGLRCEYLFCSAIYRGRITDVSPSWWTSGLIFTEDSDGAYQAYMQRDQRKLIKSISQTRAETDARWAFEDEYDHVGEFNYGMGYRKDYNDGALMLPNNKATQTGASLHTYVGGYQNLSGKKPSVGSLIVRGFRRGNYAIYAALSPLYVYGLYTPTSAASSIAFGICCAIETSGS